VKGGAKERAEDMLIRLVGNQSVWITLFGLAEKDGLTVQTSNLKELREHRANGHTTTGTSVKNRYSSTCVITDFQ
jgi:hypothetical protein